MTFEWPVVWAGLPLLLQGAVVTIALTVITMALAIPGGLILATLRMAPLAPVRVGGAPRGPMDLGEERRVHRLRRNAMADELLDLRQMHRVVLAAEADRVAEGAGTRRAADAMHVVLRVLRQVEVEDMAHFRNIQPAGSNIGSDEQLGLSFAKAIERRHSRGLIHIAMESDSIKFVPQ